MRVVIEGKNVKLDAKLVLGVGGQATVYRHLDLAVKIYHPIDAALSAADKNREAQVRGALFDKMAVFPKNLPDCVVTPRSLVFDRKKQAIGYTMPVVEGGTEIAALARRRHREGVVTNATVMRIFDRLATALRLLHSAGIVVGDLNDGNVLVVGDDIRLIDVDAMQFGHFPCPVAHERFLDPALYGVDLTKQPRFVPENDWFSFAVMLFSALLYVHPFGGVHPKIATFLRRAEAGVSLLSKLVKRPKAATDPAVLSDELREIFLDYFERGIRRPFDPALLQAPWVKCACGTEHARTTCPACRSRGVVRTRPAVVHHGACRVTSILRTVGRLVAVTVDGRGARPIEWVVEEDGQLIRDDGVVLAAAPSHSLDTTFELAGDSLWVGRGDRLIRIDDRSTEVIATSTFDSRTTFGAASGGAVVVDNDQLVEHRTGTTIGPVLSGTTWVQTGASLGFGFYRAQGVTKYFIFRPGRGGLLYVDLPAIRGRVRTVHAAFDKDTIVFSIVTDEGGISMSRLFVLRADATVVGSLAGRIDASRVLGAPRGRCVYGGQVVTATEDGLVLLACDAGVVVERTLFGDTEPFVNADTELLPAPGGSIYAITPTTINTLTLS